MAKTTKTVKKIKTKEVLKSANDGKFKSRADLLKKPNEIYKQRVPVKKAK